MPDTVLLLSVNIDHIATLRQARQESFPDPVQAAALVELGGANGITVHLRQDRRHINDRDVRLLRQTIRGELTVEMAAATDIIRFVTRVRPDQVTLVPELTTEVTTTQGLDVRKRFAGLAPVVRRLAKAGIRVAMFIEPDERQVQAAAEIGAQVVELNTDKYNKEVGRRPAHLDRLAAAAECAREQGLIVHVGHGLDYQNVVPILERKIAQGFSIGFAIVARAVFVGLREAVRDMRHILEVYS